ALHRVRGTGSDRQLCLANICGQDCLCPVGQIRIDDTLAVEYWFIGSQLRQGPGCGRQQVWIGIARGNVDHPGDIGETFLGERLQVNDSGAGTAPRYRNTGLDEQAISGDHRIAIDLQLFGKRANRRQACAGSKLAGIDQVAYRLSNLCRGLCGDRGNRVGRNERLGHQNSSTTHQGCRLKAEILGTYVTFWLCPRLRMHYLSPPLKLSSVKPLMRSMT